MKRKRINYETEMLILGIYHSGTTIMIQICEKSGCSEDSVRRVLKKHGLSVSKNHSHAKITPEIIKRVHELHDTGFSYTDIASDLKIGRTTARNIVNNYKERYKTEEKAEEIICENDSETQLQMPICTETAKDKQYEALLMMREAINMLIEASRS